VLSYCISTHRSQGSEYPVVVMPIMPQHFVMLQRNLLYTAITRARRMVVLVGMDKAVAIAVNNNKVADRYSGLLPRLQTMEVF
jgi:exodeoxyribonuclease V alpha subunit